MKDISEVIFKELIKDKEYFKLFIETYGLNCDVNIESIKKAIHDRHKEKFKEWIEKIKEVSIDSLPPLPLQIESFIILSKRQIVDLFKIVDSHIYNFGIETIPESILSIDFSKYIKPSCSSCNNYWPEDEDDEICTKLGHSASEIPSEYVCNHYNNEILKLNDELLEYIKKEQKKETHIKNFMKLMYTKDFVDDIGKKSAWYSVVKKNYITKKYLKLGGSLERLKEIFEEHCKNMNKP